MADKKTNKNNKEEETRTDQIEEKEITEELQESYIDYAMSVIVSRAIPDIRDGLKPVQRRILWAMWDDGLTYKSKFRKSANVVGQVLGRYHPHGDSAVYDAMARMAQDFSLRYPFIDGQGNWGSIDGDNQAAMRYTECRLTKISGELLEDIEKDTVNWQPNYDNTRQEPMLLPAKLPGLLLNGTMGIAVGIATSIPPHNLSEIIDATKHLIKDPEATVKDLMRFVPGPDFPTGAEIYSTEDLEDAYSKGRGSVVVRAVTDIEKRKNHMNIIIDEIPYQVNKARLIEKMAGLVQDKKIQGIKDIRDESGRDGMRIAVELKQGTNAQRVLNQLFKLTELQKKVYFNMVALVNGIQPQVVSLKDILSEYIKHRQKTIVRRIKYILKQAEDRAHILEGLVVALADIDEVIKTIKKSKDRKEAHINLVKKFKLSNIQTDAILNMKLQSLASLEAKKIKDELEEKEKLIKELKTILSSDQKILDIIVEELDEIKENYGDERRTKIAEGSLKEFEKEDFIPKREDVILLTHDGYIKRMPPKSFKVQGRGGRGLKGLDLKEEDKVYKMLVANTHDDIFFFTNNGKVFKTKVYEIPTSSRTSKGKLVHTFLGLSDKDIITAVTAYNSKENKEKYFAMATENGIIKKTAIDEFDNIRTTGIIAITLKGDDTLRWVKRSTGNDDFLFVTEQGQATRFHEDESRPMGRTASGVKAIDLKKGDKVKGFTIINEGKNADDLKLLVITEKGFGKKTPISEYKSQRRGGKGVTTSKITKKTGSVSAADLIDKEIESVIAFSEKGLVIKTDIKDIRTSGRSTQGVKIMNIKDDDTLVGIFCS